MLKLITDKHPTVTRQEKVPAQAGHVFEVSLEGKHTCVIQFFQSLAMWRWVGWAYTQVRIPDRRRFEALNARYRLSPGLYRLPLPASARR